MKKLSLSTIFAVKSGQKKLMIVSAGLAACLLWPPWGTSSLNATEVSKFVSVDAAQPDMSEVARKLPPGGQLRINNIAIEEQADGILELERFQVFTPDAKIFVNESQVLPVPDYASYRGTVQGEPESVAVLIVPASGNPEGAIMGPHGIWKIEVRNDAAGTSLGARKVEKEEITPLKCSADKLESHNHSVMSGNLMKAVSADIQGAESNTLSYAARVAVETDDEFCTLFQNDKDKITRYVNDLFAYISTLYQNEINVSLQVSRLDLRTDGNDPWQETDDDSKGLEELAAYWKTNKADVNRTLVHLLSGKTNFAGIAYNIGTTGVLCSNDDAYGLSGALTKTSLDTSKAVWDTSTVAHEIGHNFGSPHTHGYCKIGGSEAGPVDLCVKGDGNCDGMAALGLPGIGSLTGGATAGEPTGTIMSYCHLVNSNEAADVAMTFGTGFKYGVSPDRVPNLMTANVQSSIQSNPNCFAESGFLLTVSKLGRGAGTVTSNPTGISCGATCNYSFNGGQSVTLTATPANGSTFAGWGGACQSSNTNSCVITMDAAKSVTAAFNSDQPKTSLVPAVELLLKKK